MKIWKKAGLIGILVLIILTIIFGIALMIMSGGTCRFIDLGGPIGSCFLTSYMYLSFPAIILRNIFFKNILFFYIGGFLLWFFVGAIIGLIIQKIRK